MVKYLCGSPDMVLAAFCLLRYQGVYGILPKELSDIGDDLGNTTRQLTGMYRISYRKVVEIIKEYSKSDVYVAISNNGAINNFAQIDWLSNLGFYLYFLSDSDNIEPEIGFFTHFFYGFANEVYGVPLSEGGRYITLVDFLSLCGIGQTEGKVFSAGVRWNTFDHYDRFRKLDRIPYILDGNLDVAGNGYTLGAILREPTTGKRCIFGKLKDKDVPWAGYSTGLLSLSGEPFLNGSDNIGIDKNDSNSYLDRNDLPRKVSNYSALVKTFIGNGNIATFTNKVNVLNQRTDKVETVAMCGAGNMSIKVSIYQDILTNQNHADEYIEVLKVSEYNPVKIIEEWPIEDMFDFDITVGALTNLESGILTEGGTDKSPLLAWLRSNTVDADMNSIWSFLYYYMSFMVEVKLGGRTVWNIGDSEGSIFNPPSFFYNKTQDQINAQFKEELIRIVKNSKNEFFKSKIIESPPSSIPLHNGQTYYLYVEYTNGCLGTNEYGEYGLPKDASFMPVVMKSKLAARFPKYIDGIKL